MGAGLVWTERPQESFLVSIAVVIALTFTAYGFYIVHLAPPPAGQLPFLLIQALVDLGVVTTVVHFAGQPQSAFPALYVLVVAAYALLMPPATGALTAVLASALFLGDTLWTRADAPDSAFWAQMVVFNLVFAIVAVLGHRLREAGMEQETLATELQRVRLEADDILRNIRSGVLTVDGLGRLAFINPTAERLLDLEGEALIGPAGPGPAQGALDRAVGGDRGGDPERPQDQPGRGDRLPPGGADFPHRPQYHHIPAGGPGGAVGHRDLHRHLGPEGSAGAPGPRRAAGVGGRAERVAGARDPEPARLDPELGRAAGPLPPRRRGRALPRRRSSSGRATG